MGIAEPAILLSRAKLGQLGAHSLCMIAPVAQDLNVYGRCDKNNSPIVSASG